MFKWLRKSDSQSPSTTVATPTDTSVAEAEVKTVGKLTGPVEVRDRCFLPTKPSNPAEVELAKNVIRYIAQCEQLFKDPGFDLPMLPQVCLKLMNMLNDPDVSIPDISKTVQADPVLAAKFFNLANSALFAAKRRIESIEHAVSWLGLSRVKSLVMSISLHSTMFRDADLKAHADSLWDHSIACAVASEIIARDAGVSPDHCYLAGLLHDIGKLPAIMLVIKALNGGSSKIRNEFLSAMIEQFHVRAGIALLKHWNLPLEAELSIRTHYAINTLKDAEEQVKMACPDLPAEDAEQSVRLAASVVLADRAVASIGHGVEPGALDVVGQQLTLELGLMDSRVETILEALPHRISQIPALR